MNMKTLFSARHTIVTQLKHGIKYAREYKVCRNVESKGVTEKHMEFNLSGHSSSGMNLTDGILNASLSQQ